MGGGRLDFVDISFFELDRLFAQSARALRLKKKRGRRREKAGGVQSSSSRSRTPVLRRPLRRLIPPFGGFTGSVQKIERTIVINGVPQAVDERLLYEHFSRAGTVMDVHILRNRSDIPTSMVVVEFEEDEAVTKACTTAFCEILNTMVQIKRADAQLNRNMPAPKRLATRHSFNQQVLSSYRNTETGPHMRKLHIKNVVSVVEPDEMQKIFKPFGEFEAFEMEKGKTECFVTYVNHEHAQNALQSMNGFHFVGQDLQITVLPVAQPSTAAPTEPDSLDLENDTDFGGAGGSTAPSRVDLMKKLLGSR